MRIATLIVGIFGLLLVFLATGFKIMHWPGASIGMLLGYFILACIYQLLLTIHIIREKIPGIFIASRLVSAIAFIFLCSGLVFLIQHWPGASVTIMGGLVFSVPALVVFVLSIRKSPALVKKYIAFSIIPLAALLLMTGVSFLSVQRKVKLDLAVKNYYRLEQQCRLDKEKLETFLINSYDDTGNHSKAERLYKEVLETTFYINDLRKELICYETGYAKTMVDTMTTIQGIRWDDYGTPTHFLVGDHREAPTGKAKELVVKLEQLRSKYFAPSILMGIELPAGQQEEAAWIGKTFYHKTTVEVLTTFVRMQDELFKATLQSAKEKKFSTTVMNDI